jgi:hypothetical protein
MIVRVGIRGDRRDDVTVGFGTERDLGVGRFCVAGPPLRVDLRRLPRDHALARDRLRYFAERHRILLVEHGLFDRHVLHQSRLRQRQEE